jgi:hypothetical protein
MDRFLALYSCMFALAMGLLLLRLSGNPDSRARAWLLRALGSWWLSARWSEEPEERLKRMTWTAFMLAAVMFFLFLFFADLPRRY